MEKIACIFCHKMSVVVAIQEDNYQGKKCQQCALIYISPRPTRNQVVNLYGHDEAKISAQSHMTGGFLKRLYARHTLNKIKKYCTSGSLLEIGSGAGYFLDEARKKGFDPYALELNPVQADFITHHFGIPAEKKALSETSFGKKQFDVIYHCDVVSHFHNPISAFNIMQKKLRDKGLLVFETGNIAETNNKYFPAFTSFQYPDHLFFFSEQSIKQLLDRTGFQLIALHRYNILPQLRLLKWLQSKKQNVNNKQQCGAQKKIPKQKRVLLGAKNMFKKLYYLSMFFLRYYLGALLPKKGRPQTMIIIARKK